MSRAVLILVSFILLVTCIGRISVVDARESKPPEQILDILNRERVKDGTTGVLFGMWRAGRPVLVTALGNSMTTVPSTPAMHWRIGGITETFQSTLLMMLAERGRINLDDRLSKWYPRLPNADKVTVRMLVQCRAGYVDYVRVKAFLDLMTAEPFRSFTPDELIAYAMKGGKTNYPPGTSQQYSHTELVILSQVMEKATGQSLKSLYEQYILGPEGLKDTRYPSDQEIQEPVLHAFSNDRGVFEDATYFNPSWGAGNGALTSTILDIGRWGPIFGQGRLVSPASFKEMTAPSSVGLGRNRPDLYFAYEFAVSNGWYFQNPAINGYSGAFAYNPKHDITIVVAATKNASPTVDPAAFPIMRAVIEHVTPDTPLAAF